MRRTAIAAALALSACRPIFYDLVDSAGEASTGGPTGHDSETMSPTTGGDPTGPETTGPDSTSDQPPPPARCDDGAQNGLETGVDCGGPDCPPCFPGECMKPEDCDTKICVEGKCLPPQCEFAKDCPPDPCRTPECDPVTRQCLYHDLDGIPCEDGDLCTSEDMCFGGVCTPGFAAQCGGFDGPCTAGFCNPKTGNCGVEFINEGMPCEDGQACTINEFCAQGMCFGKPTPPLFFDDFSTGKGWQLGELWEIGKPIPSQCAEFGSEDPFDDHTPGPDDSLAGAVIGGCLPTKPLGPDACLTSLPIDASLPDPVWLTFHSRLSSPPGPAEALVEVWDGGQWVPVFGTKGDLFDEPTWTEHLVDVTPFKNPGLMIRFCHHQPAEALPVVSGWSVDDVMLGLPGCFPP